MSWTDLVGRVRQQPAPARPIADRTTPFGSAGLYRLVVATGAANLGDGISRYAIPLLVLGQGGGAVTVAALAVAARAPWLLGSLPAGLIADRFDRRRLAIGANLARVVLLAALGGMALAGSVAIPVVIAVAILVGLAEVLADSTTWAMVPMVSTGDQLTGANQGMVATETVANEFAGPALGGVLAGIGSVFALLSGAGLFLVAAGALVTLSGPRRGMFSAAEHVSDRDRSRTLFRDLLGGWTFIRTTPVLRGLVVTVFLTSLTWYMHQAVLIAWLVAPGPGGLSPATFGVVLAGIGAGGLVGTMMVGWIVRRAGETVTLAVDLIGCVVLAAVPAMTVNPWVVALATVIAGFGSALWVVITTSIRQRLSPPDLLGRVSSTTRLFSMGSASVGSAIALVIVAVADVRSVFVMATAFALLAIGPFLAWVRPGLVRGA